MDPAIIEQYRKTDAFLRNNPIAFEIAQPAPAVLRTESFDYDPRWKAAHGYYEPYPFRWLSDEECDEWERLEREHAASLDAHIPKTDRQWRRLFGLLNAFERRKVDKDDVKQRVDMRRLLEAYGIQTGAGRIRVFRCPFHEDRAPSFSVHFEKKLWMCHAGCSGGDCFTFVMKKEDCSFPEALQILDKMF